MSYESDTLRDWYLLFHYGSPEEILDGVGFDPSGLPEGCLEFPLATIRVARVDGPISRALDLGCAVGRSSFALSAIAEEVIGIDFSHSFVEVASEIGKGGTPAYRRYREMHLSDILQARLPDDARPGRVRFEQGDAMDLRSDLGDFDLVHAANLLCRLREPLRFLDRLPTLVRPGGKFVISTPATWLPEHTPAGNQPKGPTLEFLRENLAGTFRLEEVKEVPFLIREHQRKLQLSTAQTSLWTRV